MCLKIWNDVRDGSSSEEIQDSEYDYDVAGSSSQDANFAGEEYLNESLDSDLFM